VLIVALRRELESAADPLKAGSMRTYMKSAMPFYGVQTPALRRICRGVFDAHPLADFEVWRRTVLVLWREARFREERYAAIELTGHRRYRGFQTAAALPMYEEMVVTGGWWDLVDAIAHRLGDVLRAEPEAMRGIMLEWSRSDSLWKRRGAIICQLGFKSGTDLDLLYACIEPNLSDRDFFIRKAIGWALRDYAWTDPGEVARYVRENETRLSPLSRREALKNVGRSRSRARA
jgi:3-methyladenine DNA glycosylase AlkD